MEDEYLKETREISKTLEEGGFVTINQNNQDEASLTDKGIKEVTKWKEKHKEMDFLLFLFEGTKEKLLKMFKENKESNNSLIGILKRMFKGE